MSFLVKGDQVSFLTIDDREITMPAEHVITHDLFHEQLRHCDFVIVRPFRVNGPEQHDPDVLPLAKEYYGDHPLSLVSIEIPLNGWKKECEVKEIRYRRVGKHEGLYRHPYSTPQPLYICKKHSAWKVASPDGCEANWRGFVSP